ncbi:uncharacterized protein LOC120684927 [Panicum virgatum]|uniref:uncharacterized protein LOC120684927 n=1 Tax=Panicum virgatum TaxID=38727 RepID=UPI0019D60674|nr:uncharacterized protein LOC120684927 [Panicum virgatum]
MTKLKGLSAFHFSGNCGGSGGGHSYTSLSSLLDSFLEQGCCSSSSSSSTNANLGNRDEGAASPPAGASGEGFRPDDVAMEDKAIIKKSAERITRLLDQGMAVDSFLVRLASDVAKAAADMASLRSSRSEFQRAVVFRLREEVYDVAICQTSWLATQDVAAGNYEYIDVVGMVHGKAASCTPGERYIVDLGFRMEFAVARPTAAYALVLEALPRVLVARANVVRQVVKVAGKEARRSLKDQGLTVPPWRKKRFMAAKWFSPHRRMADTATGHHAPVVASGDAMRRTVGFVLGPPVQPWLRYCALYGFLLMHAAGSSRSAMHVHMLDCLVSIGLDTSLEYVESNGLEYARGGQCRWGNNFGAICHHVDTGYSDVLQSMYCMQG